MRIPHPRYNFVERTHSLDELITALLEIREQHGGDMAVACMKDSSDSAHLLDGDYDAAAYCSVEDVWEDNEAYRGPVVMLHIND